MHSLRAKSGSTDLNGTLTCRRHADTYQGEDQAQTSATGHTGSDGSSLLARMSRYGKVISLFGENLAWGSSYAKDMTIQLIIDDIVPSRGHSSTPSTLDIASSVLTLWIVAIKSLKLHTVRISP